ncbi:MAG: protein kinase [bacterium]|nr:protein kinase [bacterium]
MSGEDPALPDAATARVEQLAHGDPRMRYELKGEIGRGGMGAILEVFDTDLRRSLAMKVMLPGGEPQLARFLEEAQVTGQLEHPGVVPVHELGVDPGGRVYFTMKLVRGRELEVVFDLVRRQAEAWSLHRAVGVILRVCEAMEYAHDKGVVHRDLKPANVMIGEYGEVYVMDWGLARVAGRGDTRAASLAIHTDRLDVRGDDASSPLLTLDGTVVGTPSYMPPEQARGDVEELGPRADVYAVGAMLYQLLTGRMPYAEPGVVSNAHAVLGRVRAGPPAPVHEIASGVPAELEAICAKAMTRELAGRYSNMRALSDDLRAYLEGRVVRAYATGAFAELRKWVRRNRGIAIASVAAVVLALGGLASTALVQAAGKRAARQSAYLSGITLASVSLDAGNVREARRRLDAAAPELRGWEWRHLDLRSDSALHVLRGHAGALSGIAFHPEGDRLATCAADGAVRIWRVESGECTATLTGLPAGSERADLVGLAFSPDGALVAAASKWHAAVFIWDANSGELVHELPAGEGAVLAAGFAPDGGRLAVGIVRTIEGRTEHFVAVHDIATGERLCELGPHGQLVSDLAFDPRGDYLVAGTHQRAVVVWNTRTGEKRHELSGRTSGVAIEAIALSPDGALVAAGDAAGVVHVWGLESGERVATFTAHTGRVIDLAFSPTGDRLASASADASVRLWGIAEGAPERLLPHSARVLSVRFVRTGQRLVTGAEDSTTRVWDTRTGECVATLLGHDAYVAEVAVSGSGAWIATASGDGTARVWHAAGGAASTVLALHEQRVEGLDGGGASGLAASGGQGGKLVVWSVDTGAALHVLDHASAIWDVALDARGRRVAAGTNDGSVWLWDFASGRPVPLELSGHTASVNRVAFDPGGALLASGSGDHAVRAWDAGSGTCVWVGREHAASVLAVAVNADGTRLLSGSADGELVVWDARSGATLAVVPSPGGAVRAVVFEPHGSGFASGSDDGIVRLWSASGELRGELHGHDRPLEDLAFRADGLRIVSGARDGTIRVWDVRTGESISTLDHGVVVTSVAFSSDGARILAGLRSSAAGVRIWESDRGTAHRIWAALSAAR